MGPSRALGARPLPPSHVTLKTSRPVTPRKTLARMGVEPMTFELLAQRSNQLS
jgi:hypothetical protein